MVFSNFVKVYWHTDYTEFLFEIEINANPSNPLYLCAIIFNKPTLTKFIRTTTLTKFNF